MMKVGSRVKVTKQGLKSTNKCGKIDFAGWGMFGVRLDNGTYININSENVSPEPKAKDKEPEVCDEHGIYLVYFHDNDNNPSFDEFLNGCHWALDEPDRVMHCTYNELIEEIEDEIGSRRNAFYIFNSKMYHVNNHITVSEAS